MCLRIGSCCGISLRVCAIIVGVFTVIETLALIIAGGIYLNKRFTANDVGGPTGWIKLGDRLDIDVIFGALFLAFGGLWVFCTLAYIASVLVERALYILPWMVLQPITLVSLLILSICNAAHPELRKHEGLAIIPVLILYAFFYVIVFSYYLDLQESKLENKARTYKY